MAPAQYFVEGFQNSSMVQFAPTYIISRSVRGVEASWKLFSFGESSCDASVLGLHVVALTQTLDASSNGVFHVPHVLPSR